MSTLGWKYRSAIGDGDTVGQLRAILDEVRSDDSHIVLADRGKGPELFLTSPLSAEQPPSPADSSTGTSTERVETG